VAVVRDDELVRDLERNDIARAAPPQHDGSLERSRLNEFALHEKAQHALDSEAERKIDTLWSDRYAVKLIDFHEGVARDARTLIRGAVASGITSLKPGDAVHLASARAVGVAEFHTYSKDLPRFSELSGLKIIEPYVAQGQLPV
jgi:predicted nucleic acid-binding protein